MAGEQDTTPLLNSLEDISESEQPVAGKVRSIVSQIESGATDITFLRNGKPAQIPILSFDPPDENSVRTPSPDSEGSKVFRRIPWMGSITRRKSKEEKKSNRNSLRESPSDHAASGDVDSYSDGDISSSNLASPNDDGTNDSIQAHSIEFAPVDSDGDSIQNIDHQAEGSDSTSRKAYLVAKELTTSERVFVDTLRLLNVDFRNHIEFQNHNSKTKVIPDGDLKKILNQLHELQTLNEHLLTDLELRIEKWEACPKIADVIVKKGAFLKIYATYIQNFESQTQFLDECCVKYAKFGKLVKDFEATERCKKLTLKHYMLKPIQRIPQYRLLLDDYLKYLSETARDYEDTLIALRIVTDVAEHVNNSMKKGDKVGRMVQLQSQLSDFQLIKAGRELIKDGALQKVCRKAAKDRYIILVNDCLLYATPSKTFLKVHQTLPLGGMKVCYNDDDTNQFSFTVHSKTKSFILCAKSEIERKEWVQTLQSAITDYITRQKSFLTHKAFEQNENFKLGKEAPVWIQDGKVTMCQLCTAEFTQLFRRHHCRACGKVICWKCGDNLAPLQYKDYKSRRVCDHCYEKLLHDFEANEDNIKKSLDCHDGDDARNNAYLIVKAKFVRSNHVEVQKKHVPNRLKEVSAKDSGAAISGWLRSWKSHKWRVEKHWYLLKDHVLYVYGASEDIVAIKTIPVLGYTVETGGDMAWDGVQSNLVFQLKHPHQLQPIAFAVDSAEIADRWLQALKEAANVSTL